MAVSGVTISSTEATDLIVVQSYHVDRGVSSENSTGPVPAIVRVAYAPAVQLFEEDGVTPQANDFGKAVHRFAKGHGPFALVLNSGNKDHLPYIVDLLTLGTGEVVVGAGAVDLDDGFVRAGEKLLADWLAGTVACGLEGKDPR